MFIFIYFFIVFRISFVYSGYDFGLRVGGRIRGCGFKNEVFLGFFGGYLYFWFLFLL